MNRQLSNDSAMLVISTLCQFCFVFLGLTTVVWTLVTTRAKVPNTEAPDLKKDSSFVNEPSRTTTSEIESRIPTIPHFKLVKPVQSTSHSSETESDFTNVVDPQTQPQPDSNIERVCCTNKTSDSDTRVPPMPHFQSSKQFLTLQRVVAFSTSNLSHEKKVTSIDITSNKPVSIMYNAALDNGVSLESTTKDNTASIPVSLVVMPSKNSESALATVIEDAETNIPVIPGSTRMFNMR